MSAPDRQPVTLSVVVQMAGLHAPDRPDRDVTEPLDDLAAQWCDYLVTQLQRINEPRGGDLLCVVQMQRGSDRAGHEYREGRYLTERATSPAEPEHPAGER